MKKIESKNNSPPIESINNSRGKKRKIINQGIDEDMFPKCIISILAREEDKIFKQDFTLKSITSRSIVQYIEKKIKEKKISFPLSIVFFSIEIEIYCGITDNSDDMNDEDSCTTIELEYDTSSESFNKNELTERINSIIIEHNQEYHTETCHKYLKRTTRKIIGIDREEGTIIQDKVVLTIIPSIIEVKDFLLPEHRNEEERKIQSKRIRDAYISHYRDTYQFGMEALKGNNSAWREYSSALYSRIITSEESDETDKQLAEIDKEFNNYNEEQEKKDEEYFSFLKKNPEKIGKILDSIQSNTLFSAKKQNSNSVLKQK